MMWMGLLAVAAGVLIGVSRQVNGRLGLSTGVLAASFWNHAVGLAALALAGLAVGGLLPAGAAEAPWHAWLGGPVGVLFIAVSSYVVVRIGAVRTSALMIAGQMLSGVSVDIARGASGSMIASLAGVALILAGLAVVRRPTAGEGG